MMAASDSPGAGQDLRVRVEQAFAARPRPADDAIALRNDRYVDYEGNLVAAFLRGRRWQDLTWPLLRDDYPGDPTAILHFTHDAGFRYLLPAFLLMALDADVADVAQHVAAVLTDPGSGDAAGHERFHARVGGLSVAEREAVAAVLRELADRAEQEGEPDDPARRALHSHWTPPQA